MKNSEELVRLSVKDFCIKSNFISFVRKVRYNKNGYPYLTFLGKDNEAENIYFTKGSSDFLSKDTEVSMDFLRDCSIVENAQLTATGGTTPKISYREMGLIADL
jgi:hypothetical protein